MRCNQNTDIMISNEKMEQLWKRYKSEGVAKGLSMQAFCSMHDIPYNAFEKYLKLRRHFSTVHTVKISGKPDDETAMTQAYGKNDAVQKDSGEDPSSQPIPKSIGLRIMVDIRMTNGINIRQKNLDYKGLSALVEKLEVLC